MDETPESGNLDAPFGTYRISYKVDNGVLLFTRSLEVRAATIPASDYSQVRDFFGRVAGSEQSPVVLLKRYRTSTASSERFCQANDFSAPGD